MNLADNDVDEQYAGMLGAYPDEELLKLVYKFELDRQLRAAAEKQLALRGILPTDLHEKYQQAVAAEEERLAAGKRATDPQQIFGWLGIFGILGLVIGYDLCFAQEQSIYTGKQYPRYDEPSRESGRYMFYISIVTHGLFILFRLFPVLHW